MAKGTPFLTPADLLVSGLQLPPVDRQPVDTPTGTTCAITGQPISRGYRVADMVTEATAEFLDCFRGGIDGYVSENAARCFRSANPRAGNPCARSHLVFADGTYWNPLISEESAQNLGRACWSQLVRAVWPARAGQQCLVVITTDTKKRLWPKARVGALGSHTPVLVHDGETAQSGIVIIDWTQLLACLDLVEEVYRAGFSKAAIRGSLYHAHQVALAAGLGRVRQWEQVLRSWRDRPEFSVATLIAQRPKNLRKSEEADGHQLQPHLRGAQYAFL